MKRSASLPDLAMVKKVVAEMPHYKALGMTITELRHGKGFMEVAYAEKLIGNPKTGVVHGGVITALSDTVCGVAVASAVPQGTPLATLDLRIDYLRPATPGEVIRASAECYKVTDHVAFVRGLAYHDVAGDPIANSTGTFMLTATGFAPGRTARKIETGIASTMPNPEGQHPSAQNTVAALKEAGDMSDVNALIPYAQTVGLQSHEDERGLITVLRSRESNIGNYYTRAVHGGLVGALLEHAGILHLLAETEAAVVPKIINLSVDYLRPCQAADTFARGTVIKQGRRVANVRVEAWQDKPERPVAAAHAHFLLSERSE